MTTPATATLLPLLLLLATPLAGQTAAAGSQRFPADHAERGLPRPEAVWAPFAEDPEHPCNRVFRALFLARVVPTEVATALPREHGDAAGFYVPGWYFGKRAGGESDARLFGGDGRQLPREGFTAAEAEALTVDLRAIDGEVAAALRTTPPLAIWFQNDLLRLARRLLDTQQNAELLPDLFATARRVALPAAAIAAVAPTFALADLAQADAKLGAAKWTEIQRRSSRLFDAEYSLAWARVHIALPDGAEPDLAQWLTLASASPKDPPPLPIGTRAVLQQGLMALDDAGRPHATALVFDVRVQALANRDGLAHDNLTTTRDGVDFAMWSLPRQTLREHGSGTGFADFRAVPMDDQELFRDYGTLKYTTNAGQCSLCHRRSNGPDEALAGFSALRPGSKPRAVAAADERLRQAEAEFAKLIAKLGEAANGR